MLRPVHRPQRRPAAAMRRLNSGAELEPLLKPPTASAACATELQIIAGLDAAAVPHLHCSLGSLAPLPHLHWGGLAPVHICTGTGLTPATSASGLGSPPVSRPQRHRSMRRLAAAQAAEIAELRRRRHLPGRPSSKDTLEADTTGGTRDPTSRSQTARSLHCLPAGVVAVLSFTAHGML